MTTKRMRNNWICVSTRKTYIPSDKTHGIVYLITDLYTGMFYVGKKQVYKDKPLGKKEMAMVDKIDKRKKYTKRVFTDWATYTTSNKELSKLIKNSGDLKNVRFVFEVIHECYDETVLKYKEAEEIFISDAFSSKNGYNDNVQIKQIGTIKNFEKRFKAL